MTALLKDWIVLPFIVLGTVAAVGLMVIALVPVARAAVRARLNRGVDDLPHREPGAALDAATAREARLGHIDAVWALCCDSASYVEGRLAPFEDDVTDLAELVLELDDQSPRPSIPED